MDGMFNGGEDDIHDEQMWDFDDEGRASTSAPPPLSEKISGGKKIADPDNNCLHQILSYDCQREAAGEVNVGRRYQRRLVVDYR
jgi:hypothetical protein